MVSTSPPLSMFLGALLFSLQTGVKPPLLGGSTRGFPHRISQGCQQTARCLTCIPPVPFPRCCDPRPNNNPLVSSFIIPPKSVLKDKMFKVEIDPISASSPRPFFFYHFWTCPFCTRDRVFFKISPNPKFSDLFPLLSKLLC